MGSVKLGSFNFQLKIAICDDDKNDMMRMSSLVSSYLDKHHYNICVDKFSSGEDFLNSDFASYNLVILDIFMGGLNGIETARIICEKNPNMQIVFCSSSNAYAEESYDVFALRYLTKPVEADKLNATLDRFFHIHTKLRTLVYKQNRMDESVYLSDILWVEANGHTSIIHTRNGDVTTRTPFAKIAEQVEGADFVKPIRYALVSLNYVASIPTDVFTLKNGLTVPISRDLRPDIKKAFSDFKMRQLLRKGGSIQ